MITAVRCKIHKRSISEHYYPYGNTRIRNVLKDFNCKISGDSTDTESTTLGCGDLRNAFQATTAKNLQVLDIHVNDVHPAVLARNIIILKIISAPDFNPNDIEDISFLWDVLYNMDWPEVTRKRFLSVIKDLLDNKLPDEVVIPKRTDIEMFMALWETWQSVSSTTVFESKILLKKVQKQRKELLFQTSCNSNPEDLAETKAVALKKLVEGLQVGSVDFENSVWETIHEEARKIVTDSFECASAVKELIEKSLCAPLSLIPTIYGLRLVNHVELGDASHHHCWQKVAPFQNITMGSSPVLKKCLEKLAVKSYCVLFPYHEDMEAAEGWELLVYTPLTFVYVCSSMFHRLGKGPWLQDVFNLKHSFCFDLTKRTLTDWMQGKKITKYLSRIKLNPLNKTAAHTKLTGANMLRLILLPKTFVSEFLNKMKKGCVDVSTSNVHFIDNFQLQVNRTAIGIKEICVSFFLIPNHGLKKTHTAIVVDPQFLKHYFTLGSMESMQEEELNLPYPFEISKAQLTSSRPAN
ncbi:hypothetical protein DAPPUDRAFT_116814 [Daphnia pulex]|uniref:DUF4470 domain-containing protein n=1 Tax=Daphnia pulex TaxID=6669 RepID=E9HQL5_DAPPU|nr:hypothetical protein DAPPUDRAFT_116814 [Daphnia pulex]|eukprot:EFX65966.1 hypothetical protein DAPPUDRAFT_116814 [Daphnia pulex]